MKNNISSTNISFEYLKNSSDFLNILVNNICSCVLLLDNKMKLQAYNDPLFTIFSNKEGENLIYVRCGEAIGCAHQIKEMKECGKTSHCQQCRLREAALISYTEKKPIYREKVSREFFRKDGIKEMKHLRFSTRTFYFEDEYYILMIIDDITALINQQTLIAQQKNLINEILQ